MKKKILILFALSIIVNVYLAVKVFDYRNRVITINNGSPLIERIYTKIGSEVNYESPIVFTGDSMIHRMNWNYLFRKISNGKEFPIILNRAIGGNTTTDLLRRFNDNVLSLNPSSVFIEIGTVDFKEINKSNKNEIETRLVHNYKKIIEQALESDENLNVYIISILPVHSNIERNHSARRVNRILKDLSSKDSRLHYIDCFDTFFDNENNKVKNELMIETHHTHLNDLGYEKWAEVLSEHVLNAQ